jgi:hypothetical protein
MKNLKKALLLSLAMVSVFYCRGDQFNIPNGDIAALKAAIIASNSNNKPDTIHLPPFGMYRFMVADNDYLASGANALPPLQLDVSDANALVIFGNGATFMRDPSIDVLRLLYAGDLKVTIYDLNFIGGSTLQFDNEGGAIMINSAKVTLENCLLKNNRATNGGAVYLVARGSFTAKNCTFTGNIASAGTGSAFASTYGNSYFQNCVIANNSCVNVNVPAAIYNFIPLNSNTALDNIFLKNCIVAKNTYDNPTSPDNGKEFDMSGAIYSDGGNVIGSYPVVMQVSLPTFRQGTPGARNDWVGTETNYVDPLLGTLGDHGLFTDFYPVLAGSPALSNGAGIKNAGIPAVASNGIVPAEAYPGETITMTGINLQSINKVQFAGAPTTVSGITSTSRTVQVAVHANARTGQILLMDPAPRFIFTIQTFKVKAVVTPGTPTNFAGVPESTSSIKLTWNDVADENDYQVEYKRATDNTYSLLGIVSANVTTYTAENLLCGVNYNFRVIARGHGTFSPPSNVIQSAPFPLQSVTLTPPSSTEGCTGGIITVAAPGGYSTYHWNTGETTQAIDAEDSGAYSVQVTDASGCTSPPSTPVTVTFYNYPDTAVTQTGNNLSTAVVADHYQWYRNNAPLANETANTLTVTQVGVYKLELSNHGCTSTGRDIAFIAPATPVFEILSVSTCAGASGITYSVLLVNGVTYHWSYSGHGFTITSGTSSHAILADFGGNATSGTLSIEAERNGLRSEPAEINVTINNVPVALGNIVGSASAEEGSENNIYTVSDPGNVSFDWLYDGTGATLTINNNVVSIDFENGAAPGTLSVAASNACGIGPESTIGIVIWPQGSLPLPPSNFMTTAISTSSVELTWDDVSDEIGYQIEYKKSGDNTFTTLQIQADLTTYTIDELLCIETYDFRIISLGNGNQSVASDVMRVRPLQLSQPVISPTSSTEGCIGESMMINAPSGFAAYLWSNGETTEILDVSASGDYSVQVTDESGCSSVFSIPLNITFYDYPDATVVQDGNTLTTPVIADQHQWYFEDDPLQDETSNSLTVTQTGAYHLELRNHGCSSFSQEFTFEAPLPPEFVAASTTICAGSAGVNYSVSPISNATYHWTFSGTGLNIVSGMGTNAVTVDFGPAAISGILSVEAEVFGFRSQPSEITININDVPSPLTSIAGNSTLLSGSTGNIFSVSDSGGVTFDWSYDGDGVILMENNNSVSIDLEPGATSGTLTVSISNECGSIVGATLFLNVEHAITGTEEVISDQISVYPSPSDGKFTINVPHNFGRYKMTISNLLGSLIFQTFGSGATPVDLHGHSRGFYFVVIETSNRRYLKKIFIK